MLIVWHHEGPGRSMRMLLQGNVGARRAAYEARWHSFGQAVKAGGKDLRYAQVPWPAEEDQGIRAVVLYGTSTADEVDLITLT